LTRGIIEELRAAGLEIRRIDGDSDTQSEALNCAGFCPFWNRSHVQVGD